MTEQKRKYRGIYWLIFLVSLAGLGFAIYHHWAWLVFIMPFVATSFVKALDII